MKVPNFYTKNMSIWFIRAFKITNLLKLIINFDLTIFKNVWIIFKLWKRLDHNFYQILSLIFTHNLMNLVVESFFFVPRQVSNVLNWQSSVLFLFFWF